MASSHPGLLDLPEDILYLLLRVYVPLKEKLYVLFQIPEFRRLLTRSEAYPPLPVDSPFSPPYLDLLRCIRPGGYAAREDPFHRVHLQIDERTLEVSLRHYRLAGSGSSRVTSPDTLRFRFFTATLPHLRSNLLNYLEEYCSEDLLLTYRDPQRGFIVVRPPRMWLPDGTTVPFSSSSERTLWVEGAPLSPIEFRDTSGGLRGPDGTIPLAAQQQIRWTGHGVLFGGVSYEAMPSSWRIPGRASS